MKSRWTLLLASSALAAVALAGCSMSPTPASNGGTSSKAPAKSAASSADLSTGDSSLGTIVVNGKGLTAYYYDNDTANSGKSSCTGSCASLWPAITSTSTKPTVSGVTGTVGTIMGTGGGNQVTINGRPIYTFTSDTKAGDINGEGVDQVWYAVSPAGKEITGPTSRY